MSASTVRPLAAAARQLQRAPARRAYNTTANTTQRALLASRRPVSQALVRSSWQQVRKQSTTEALKSVPRRGGFRSFLRWTWRVTYITIIAGVVYTGYEVWQSKHPNDQFDPDPSKKTLVVLGKCL